MFGGGFFGGMPMPNQRPRGNSTRYYELLGVDKDASEQELKRAHRKLALKLHPDKGGDPDKFKEINEAYDVLKDPEKRRIYDEYGEEAIKEGAANGGGAGGMSDLFETMFGGGSRRRQEPKGEDIVHKVSVKLEDLFNGTTRKLALNRKIKCGDCEGTGSKSKRRYKCEKCNGTGIEVRIKQLGPGMIQQIQMKCTNCGGTGYKTPPEDLCLTCGGSGLVKNRKVFEVGIEPGMKDGQKVVFKMEAGYSDPSINPGDVIFLVEAKEHPTFKRVNVDLVIEKKISLVQALCGTPMVVTHLDGRTIKFGPPEGYTIQPDSWHRVEEEGMPVHGSPMVKGNMYVHVEVEFPEQVSLDQRMDIVRTLGLPNDPADQMEDEDYEELQMSQVIEIQEELRARARFGKDNRAGYSSSDSEDGHGAQRVRCAQQ